LKNPHLANHEKGKVKMSSHKSDIKNVERALSKVEETLDKVEEAIPQLDKAIPQLKAQVSMLGVEPLKKVAEWYIDTAEEFANYGFVLQESGMSWAKDTPWAHLFGIQASIGRKLIGNSAMAARFLWQIPQSPRAA
jgi:predicted nuclease with TOPRIM domain